MAAKSLQFTGSSAKKTGIGERCDHLTVRCAVRQRGFILCAASM
jgi:hypothetical protein